MTHKIAIPYLNHQHQDNQIISLIQFPNPMTDDGLLDGSRFAFSAVNNATHKIPFFISSSDTALCTKIGFPKPNVE